MVVLCIEFGMLMCGRWWDDDWEEEEEVVMEELLLGDGDCLV